MSLSGWSLQTDQPKRWRGSTSRVNVSKAMTRMVQHRSAGRGAWGNGTQGRGAIGPLCHFERFLSAEHLRTYLKRLPDFEDFEAEQKALEVAAGHKQTERALAFLIEWRARDRADRLVRERLAALDGRF
jgi:hypothetical protein